MLRRVMSKPQKLYHYLVLNDRMTMEQAIHFELLWNLEDPVLIQTRSCKRKITCYLFIPIGFFHKLN